MHDHRPALLRWRPWRDEGLRTSAAGRWSPGGHDRQRANQAGGCDAASSDPFLLFFRPAPSPLWTLCRGPAPTTPWLRLRARAGPWAAMDRAWWWGWAGTMMPCASTVAQWRWRRSRRRLARRARARLRARVGRGRPHDRTRGWGQTSLAEGDGDALDGDDSARAHAPRLRRGRSKFHPPRPECRRKRGKCRRNRAKCRWDRAKCKRNRAKCTRNRAHCTRKCAHTYAKSRLHLHSTDYKFSRHCLVLLVLFALRWGSRWTK